MLNTSNMYILIVRTKTDCFGRECPTKRYPNPSAAVILLAPFYAKCFIIRSFEIKPGSGFIRINLRETWNVT